MSTGEGSRRETALIEFNALRSEHDSRIVKQQEISNVAVALFAALSAALAFGLKGAADVDSIVGSSLLTTASSMLAILLLTLNLMILDHEQNIAEIQVYIAERIMPNLASINEISDVNWIRYRAGQQQGRRLSFLLGSALPSAKHAFCFLPATIALIAGPSLYTKSYNSFAPGTGWIFWSLFGTAVAFWVFTVVGLVYTSRIYLKLARPLS